MARIDLVHESFKYHLMVMKYGGIYPFDSWPKFYKPYAYFTYVVFTIIPPVLSLIKLILSKETDLEVIIQGSSLVVEMLPMTFKILPCKINPEGIRRTIYTLNKDIFNSHLPEQDPILFKIVKNCRLIFEIICIDFLIATVALTTKPLWYSDRRFTFDVWVPFDATRNTAVYWTIYMYIALDVLYAASYNAALDTLVTSLMYHATGQVRILKDNLQHLDRRAEEEASQEASSSDNTEELKSKIIYKRICQCIEHYDAISEFVQDVEKTYSPVMFSQFLTSIVVVGMCVYHLSVAVFLSQPFWVTLIFSSAILGELFLPCYSGSLLFEESKTILDAVYFSEWYNFDEKSKRALLTLMERAKRPMIFTAGKLMDVSLETFTMIMRRSYSVLALLKNS